MYKVLPVEGGWQVFWIESPDTEPRRIDGRIEPYRQRQAAYRRCKKLNDAVKRIDEQIERDGADASHILLGLKDNNGRLNAAFFQK